MITWSNKCRCALTAAFFTDGGDMTQKVNALFQFGSCWVEVYNCVAVNGIWEAARRMGEGWRGEKKISIFYLFLGIDTSFQSTYRAAALWRAERSQNKREREQTGQEGRAKGSEEGSAYLLLQWQQKDGMEGIKTKSFFKEATVKAGNINYLE